jgi:ABC-2 type transport system ATP-binding protein
MLLGLLRPSAGAIQIFNMAMPQQRLAILQHVGALVEMPSLYPHLTGYENLAITRRLRRAQPADIRRALAMVRLEGDAGRLVRGYSLGMRQRLALALALLQQPALLILDEPSNGLDPAGIQEMRDLLRRLPEEQGITVFLSSHLLSEVQQVASHVGILRNGRLLFQGSLASLEARHQAAVLLSVDQPQAARQLLETAGYHVEQLADARLRIQVQTGTEEARLNALLVRQQIAVYALSRPAFSLEEVFLQLTRDDESPGSLADA